jgi:putative peptidoglycan lipid II flippase
MYFLILIPGLVMYHFKWTPQMNLKQPYVQKILNMLGPRVGGMLLYQLTFIARDNIASRLSQGSVSALTYGYMILQVPETLIGTAIGTVLLPTISEMFAKGEREAFDTTIDRTKQVLIALAVPSTILLAVVLRPFLEFAFGFDAAGTQTLLWVTRAFLAGLLSHCLLELGSRIYFARQNTFIPFIGSAINLVIYILFGTLLSKPLGAAGIALSDATAFTAQTLYLFLTYGILSCKEQGRSINFQTILKILAGDQPSQQTAGRAILGSLAGGLVIILIMYVLGNHVQALLVGLTAALVGMIVALLFVRKELNILFHM